MSSEVCGTGFCSGGGAPTPSRSESRPHMPIHKLLSFLKDMHVRVLVLVCGMADGHMVARL